MSHTHVHRLVLPLVFPEGIRPGAGKTGGNRLQLAKDGRGNAVLRGTALAGALRHAYAAGLGVRSMDPQVARWFGASCDGAGGDERGLPSPLKVSDLVLPVTHTALRHHNAVDRHLGSVRPNGLFDVEVLPPGVCGKAVLLLETYEEDLDEARAFLQALVGMFKDGLTLGGNAARGIGRAHLDAKVAYQIFDRGDLEQDALFLEELHNLRKGTVPQTGEVLEPVASGRARLVVKFTLRVPRGQDLCVGDGQGLDHEIEPQFVVDAQGKSFWKLPGSSLRGLFRGWCSRLAAKENFSLADSHQRAKDRRGHAASGRDFAWGFMNEKQRIEIQRILIEEFEVPPEQIVCPVMRLFGSSFSKGRIHISDALAPIQDATVTERKHVAVDRISGGANDGFLFSNTVLHGSKLRFTVHLTIEHPEEHEARWIAKTLRALDMGLLRVGSSKSGGRLALDGRPTAQGPFSDAFKNITPLEGA